MAHYNKMVLAHDEARKRRLALLRWAAFFLFWPAFGIVVWGELTPGGGIPGMWDKLQHFIAYGGLAGLAAVALGSGRRALWSLVVLVIVGGVLEIVQGFVGRDASWGDELANGLGAIAGTLVAIWLIHLLRDNQPA